MAPRRETTGAGRAKIANGKRSDFADMSDEEIEAINAKRPPSERVRTSKERCGARLKDDPTGQRTHTTCLNNAGEGTSHPGIGHCKFHGGSTAAGNKSAAREFGRQLIQGQKEKFGGDRKSPHIADITPEIALIEEVRRSVAMVRWLEERIGTWHYEVNPDDPELPLEGTPLGGLPALIDETARGASTFTDEREWLLLYREERRHAAQVAKMAIDAGLAERMVRLAEDQGRMLAAAIRAVLDAMGLSPEQRALVPTIVPAILRQVSAGLPVTPPALPALPSTSDSD